MLFAVGVVLLAVGVVLLAVVVLVWWVLVGPRGQWHPLTYVRLVVALLLVGFCGGWGGLLMLGARASKGQ